RIEVEPEARAARVPSLLLQPVVENAVRHAIAPREEGGVIVISGHRTNGRLHLVVEDDGPGIHGNERGIGLANTQERLRYRYGGAHRFEPKRGSLGGLRVDMELPFDDGAS